MESQIDLLLVPDFPLKAPGTPRCTPTPKDLGPAIMNLKQLRIIREIVRSKYNVTEAAAALFTSCGFDFSVCAFLRWPTRYRKRKHDAEAAQFGLLELDVAAIKLSQVSNDGEAEA